MTERIENICVFGACQEVFVVNVWIGAVTAVATLLAVVIAWYELGSGRKDEAVRETFKAIDFESSSAEWRAVRTQFVDLMVSLNRDPQRLLEVLKSQADDSSIMHLVRTVLNRYEVVGILLRRGGGDLETYLSWFRSSIVRECHFLWPTILYLRSKFQTPRAFSEFEWLASKASLQPKER